MTNHMKPSFEGLETILLSCTAVSLPPQLTSYYDALWHSFTVHLLLMDDDLGLDQTPVLTCLALSLSGSRFLCRYYTHAFVIKHEMPFLDGKGKRSKRL